MKMLTDISGVNVTKKDGTHVFMSTLWFKFLEHALGGPIFVIEIER